MNLFMNSGIPRFQMPFWCDFGCCSRAANSGYQSLSCGENPPLTGHVTTRVRSIIGDFPATPTLLKLLTGENDEKRDSGDATQFPFCPRSSRF